MCNRLTPLAALALLSATALASPQGERAPDRRSLEDLLREAKTEHARRTAELAPEIERLIRDIESLRAKEPGPVTANKKRGLTALGPSAIPMLVPYLEPGEDAKRAQVFRSQLIADFLSESATTTITDELLEMALGGSIEGRMNALLALSATAEPTRIAPRVISLAKSSSIEGLSVDETQTVRDCAYRTVAKLDTPDARAFLAESLAGGDIQRASSALRALQGASPDESAPQVLALLDSDAASRLAEPLVAYYSAHELLLEDDEHAEALGRVSVHDNTRDTPRAALFHLLRVTDAEVGTKVKRAVQPFTAGTRNDVRNAALLLMARLGDRKARKALLETLDERVRNGRNLVSAYSDRAGLYHKIGDWSAASKDWKDAMKIMSRDRVRAARKEPFIGLARAQARLGKFRDAAETLNRSPLSIEERQDLAHERDFRKMLETNHREVFRLDW